MTNFARETQERIASNAQSTGLISASRSFLNATLTSPYSYTFSCRGRPIIQDPPDMVALQELIWLCQPDLIIETGIAHGGSLIFSASMLALLDYCEASRQGISLDPRMPTRKVIGIDIDIRRHNREAIESHPMASRIEMIQGSSIDADVIRNVSKRALEVERVLVCLDSNHTHEHVLKELEAYAPLVTLGSYCVVFDTVVEDMPEGSFPDRPWDKGNNPKTAVWEYLKSHPEFEIDKQIDHKLLISVAPDGYLRRVR